MKAHKKALTVFGSTIGILAIIWGMLTISVFHFPQIKNNIKKENLKINKWYRMDVDNGNLQTGVNGTDILSVALKTNL